MTADYALPPQTNGLVERSHQMIMLHDWEAGRRQES